MRKKPEQPDIGKAWDRAIISSRILKTSILAVSGDSDRHRYSIDRKSGCACCERDGFVGRQIGASAWSRSVDVNSSINRRHSGFAADNGCADARRNCCGCRTCRSSRREEPGRDRPATHGRLVQAIPGLGGRGRYTGTGRARTTRQAAPVQVVQDAPAQVRPVKKYRRSGPCKMRAQRSGPSEITGQGSGRSKCPGQVPPVADPRVPDPSVQNAQTPSLLQSLGLRN